MSAKKQQVLANTAAYDRVFKSGKTLYLVYIDSHTYKFVVQTHALRGKPVTNRGSRTVGFVEERTLDRDMNLKADSKIFFGMSAEQYEANKFVKHNLNKGAGCRIVGNSYNYEYDPDTGESVRKKLPWHPTHSHLEGEYVSSRFSGLYCKTKYDYFNIYDVHKRKRPVVKYKNAANSISAAPARQIKGPDGISYVSVVAGILCGVYGEMNYGRAGGYVRPAAPGGLRRAHGAFLSRRAAEKFAAELNSGVYPEAEQIIKERKERDEDDRRMMLSSWREDYDYEDYGYDGLDENVKEEGDLEEPDNNSDDETSGDNE